MVFHSAVKYFVTFFY